jgi:hypothetical protein
MTATPGMFCDAMVTTYSGSAITDQRAPREFRCTVNTGLASSSRSPSTYSSPCVAARTMPSNRVTTMA